MFVISFEMLNLSRNELNQAMRTILVVLGKPKIENNSGFCDRRENRTMRTKPVV